MTKEERENKGRELHRSGLNCCQSVVMAYADKLPIEPEHALAVASPFGRGIAGCREVCGCVSGMAIVCGLTGHTADVRPLIDRFREDNGEIVCAKLLKMGKRPCNEMVAYASGLLADIV